MKTKAEEIEILERTIDELGPGSYLGSWLHYVREEVAREIRSDHYPTMMPSEARAEAARMLAEAKVTADGYREAAVTARKREMDQATAEVSRLRARVISDIEAAVKRVSEGW